ncbi:uncharacterized protein LOC112591498 [Melanaphis sacchari]|uniref:uncharacterized protein LOC112591498 n=1 Tax=Melanaphis sacchari TaxID=742174 RepID=UPI000DC13349|nr:uncharacterized protein LOC112591498 [Melanaphis sacchari]
MFFLKSQLLSLSTNISKTDIGHASDFEYYLITDCECYKMYTPRKNFIENVLKRRDSYMACLAYNSTNKKRKRIKHRCVFVIFGTYQDYLIRGELEVRESRILWGSFIRLGNLETYNIFSTFNSLSTHVYSTDLNLIVEIYFYVDDKGVELRYHKGVVHVVYNKQNYYSNDDPATWISLLNRANPYTRDISGSEYIKLFNAMLCYDYDMNDLKNRQFLTYTTILNRVICSGLSKKNSTITNVRELFENGNIFNLLSKKSVVNNETVNKSYPQSYSNNIDNGRSNKICDLITTVKRTMNDAFKNSEALRFPEDGIGIICPISVKDLKDAGEQNVLADYVLVSESENDLHVYEYLQSISISPEKLENFKISALKNAMLNRKYEPPVKKIKLSKDDVLREAVENVVHGCAGSYNDDDDDDDIKNDNDTDDGTEDSEDEYEGYKTTHNNTIEDKMKKIPVTIVLNEFLCGIVVFWSFDVLLRIKKRFPHATTLYFYPYVFVITKSCIPLKYHEDHDAYFSPAEITEYKLTFPSASNYSYTWKHLNPWARHMNPSAKSTVSINNIKGSVANVESQFQYNCMLYSLGITCYININDNKRKEIFESAIVDTGIAPYTMFFDRIKQMGFVTDNIPIIKDTDPCRAVESLRRMYDFEKLNYRCCKRKPESYDRYFDVNLKEKADRYINMIIENDNKEYSVFNMRVWACFGNMYGNCIEDGVVVDSTFAKLVPDTVYNACIGVSFISKTNKNNCIFVPIREKKQSKDPFIGYVITEEEISIRHSRHCYILKGVIGNHCYYLIHFNPKTNLKYSDLSVEHVKHNKTLMVLIKGKHYGRFGLGSKIANSFGQKNIISKIEDIRSCEKMHGVTRDGRKVFPQIVYSDVSIISRDQSSQYAAALRSPDLAFGPNGEIIFPLDIIIHTLHPYTNNHPFVTRSDTFANSNGFETQGLAQTNFLLRMNKNVQKQALNIIGLHGFEIIDASGEYLEFYKQKDNNILSEEAEVVVVKNRNTDTEEITNKDDYDDADAADVPTKRKLYNDRSM